jgi:metal-responsive CopG/Arc/MetJ family transcriptional regulator
MRSLSLKLPDELHSRLVHVSRERGTAKSEVVRAALEAYFADKRRGSEISCAELAGDLVGSVEGPDDLASHPKHLQGYGR